MAGTVVTTIRDQLWSDARKALKGKPVGSSENLTGVDEEGGIRVQIRLTARIYATHADAAIDGCKRIGRGGRRGVLGGKYRRVR